MLMYLIIALATAVPNQAHFESNQVDICVNVHSNIYTYKVTNLGSKSIVGFEIKKYASYNFMVPDGWQMDTSSGLFHAWTTDAQTAITKNKTAEFSLRVSSKGAVLGVSAARVQLQSGQTVIVPGVWGPVPEPRSYIVLIGGLILLILLLHTVILTCRHRRKAKTD